MGKTVFLDRDGVINIDSAEYIKNESEFFFIDKSPEAIAKLTRAGFDIIVITNQSVLARKFTTSKELEKIFNKMTTGVEALGGKIKDIFFCPHMPNSGCSCRKPKPGLIFQAKEKYDMDLSESYMVGDSVKDIECAKNAGCGFSILVKTGNGQEAEKILAEKKINPDFIAQNLFDAVNWIIQQSG